MRETDDILEQECGDREIEDRAVAAEADERKAEEENPEENAGNPKRKPASVEVRRSSGNTIRRMSSEAVGGCDSYM